MCSFLKQLIVAYWLEFVGDCRSHRSTATFCGHRPGAAASLHGSREKPSLVGKGLINLNTALQKNGSDFTMAGFTKNKISSQPTHVSHFFGQCFIISMIDAVLLHTTTGRILQATSDNIEITNPIKLRPFNWRKSTKHFPTMICSR